MTKVYTFCFAWFVVFVSHAQVSCIIDSTNNTQGISPAPDEIPCIVRTEYYEEVVQVLVPATVAVATVDSFEVLTVSGYPSDMQYVSNPASKRLLGGERGCFVFYGTTNEPKGYYEIGFTGRAWVKIGGQSSVFPLTEQQAKDAGFDLFVEVIEPGETCRQSTLIFDDKLSADASIKAFFSEGNTQLMVDVQSRNALNGKLNLVNMIGETIATSDITATNHTTVLLNTSGVPKGIYMIFLQSGGRVFSKKILSN